MIARLSHETDLSTLAQSITNYIPEWIKDGLNQRKRGQLGFRLMAAHQTGVYKKDLCKKIAEFKQNTGLSAFAPKDPSAEDKSRTHKVLAQITSLAPTLAVGLVTTLFFNTAGLVIQVSDTMRINSGHAFLNALENHGINLENPKAIRAALNEPEITKDLYSSAIKSSALEATLGSAIFGLGEGAAILGHTAVEFIPVEVISDNIMHTASRLAPNFSQTALRSATYEIKALLAKGLTSLFGAAGGKGVRSAKDAFENFIHHKSKERIDMAFRNNGCAKASAILRAKAVDLRTRSTPNSTPKHRQESHFGMEAVPHFFFGETPSQSTFYPT